MSEILKSEEVHAGYEEGIFDARSEKESGKIVQLKQEELSPVNYKTQVLLSMFLGALGANHFHAGNHEKGVTTLLGTVILNYFNLGKFTNLLGPIFLLQLNEGNYTDSDGKVIRQVVQLKKEEISSTDQKTTLILGLFLGLIGAHQFYTGKPLKGILMLCTFGGLGIWTIMNIYQIATCDFRDGEDKVLCPSYIKASHGM